MKDVSKTPLMTNFPCQIQAIEAAFVVLLCSYKAFLFTQALPERMGGVRMDSLIIPTGECSLYHCGYLVLHLFLGFFTVHLIRVMMDMLQNVDVNN